MYRVLGNYDALIRLWVTPERRRRFLLLARRNNSPLDAIQEFQTDDHGIDYRWWPDLAEGEGAANPRDHREVIESIVRAHQDGSLAFDANQQHQLEALSELGLAKLFATPAVGQESIKFYVALSSKTSADRTQIDKINDELVRHVASIDRVVHTPSLYLGNGFARIMLKGVADSFSSFTAVLESITAIASSLNFKTMSLLFFGLPDVETDAINSVYEELSRGVVDTVEEIGERAGVPSAELNLRRRFEAMVGTDREYYVQVMRQYPTVFAATAESVQFYRLLYAIIVNDVELFGDSLNFLQKTESLLRRHLFRIWKELFGVENYISRLKEIATKAGHRLILSNSQPSLWSLRDLIGLAGEVAREDMEFRLLETSDPKLGPDWRSIMGNVTPLRNHLAHGRVYEYEDLHEFYPSVNGKEQLTKITQICAAAEFYLRFGAVDRDESELLT